MNLDRWTREEFDGVPIYINGNKPDWFVPNTAADNLLRQIKSRGMVADSPMLQRLADRLPESNTTDYNGRDGLLKLRRLSEIWFHITNNCNQACRHCLFSCSNKTATELPAKTILTLAKQASSLGCTVFALTGGEPFVHRNIVDIIDGLLSYKDSHIVVLTNGLMLRKFKKELTKWPSKRFHLQISADGMQKQHDSIRGKGSFAKLEKELHWLGKVGIPYTLSMCAGRHNHMDMPDVVDFSDYAGAAGVHFMWYFARGRGKHDGMGKPDELFDSFVEACSRASGHKLGIDNLDAMRTQVFAPPGTKHDGSNSGWESIAIGPDGLIYPSAALVGLADVSTALEGDLVESWRNSDVLKKLRSTTAARLESPWRYIIGGGDPDHSYVFSGKFSGIDPYLPLHEKIAKWLIAREASNQSKDGPAGLRLKMGDILESCGAHGAISMVHSNCLLSMADKDTRTVVKQFYAKAAVEPRIDILNPVSYPDEYIDHVPGKYRFRGYGCGSPVLDAGIELGDRVLDLGCGRGIECFIASRLVGDTGHVTGVDMLDTMLSTARKGAMEVARNLGYDNLEFRKDYLEELSLEESSFDVVVSNCVINLSKDKRRTFKEVLRVLRPGGRLVVADVVSETEPCPEIRNDEQLRGECIAGALTQRDLFALLGECGFVGRKLLKRSHYRTVEDHPFFSMTFEATKPTGEKKKVRVLYKGPFEQIITSHGTVLTPGSVKQLYPDEIVGHGDNIFILDEKGIVLNMDMDCSCSCSSAPEHGDKSAGACDCATPPAVEAKPLVALGTKHVSGCMLCGAELKYTEKKAETSCVYCGEKIETQTLCVQGHFVCDSCHTHDGLEVIKRICLNTGDTDMLSLLETIRKHPAVPVHGPEHHAMVPGIILATYKNLGGEIFDEDIITGIERGAKVPGGYCGFVGACGAALGVGTAFAIIIKSNPVKPYERMSVQSAVQAVIGKVATFQAARCCQRDSWAALTQAAILSKSMLPLELKAKHRLVCHQQFSNKECMGKPCPLFKPTN